MPKNSRLAVFLFILLFIFTGCAGKEEVKPSEEAESSLRAIEKIEGIKEAYSKKDIERLETLINKDLFNKIKNKMEFKEAKLDILSPRFILINNEEIRLSMTWYGEWLISNRTLKKSGIGIFIFDRKSMKLVEIKGDNPFIPVEIE